MNQIPEKIHFVTGRFAEPALRAIVEKLAVEIGFRFSVDVLPITVAALMSPDWIRRHVQVPSDVTRVLIPGYVGGDLDALTEHVRVPVERGPRDLRQLPEFFGEQPLELLDRDQYSIEVLAEINHAPRLDRHTVLSQARQLVGDGADVVDIGCEPGDPWMQVGDCVKALRDEGFRVSIDSFHPVEIRLAVQAGAELVLSVNSTNRQAAADWGCEVVAIPDNLAILDGLDETMDYLAARNVPLRVDPILEPIGMGFGLSLWRYLDVRRRYPDVPMLMGIGNITEMTDADSAGLNLLLLGFCQELGVQSVLTTQVINWARSSVRECDLARRFVYHAVRHHVPLKHVATDLVLLRDQKLQPFGEEGLEQLAQRIKDDNIRVFSERGLLHLLSAQKHLSGRDAFELFDRLLKQMPGKISLSHAFYLGFEMAKATVAMTLDKEYRQDEPLDWGYLTDGVDSQRLS